MTDRTSLLRSMLDLSRPGLEIGPSHNPLVPKSAGYQVETLDYADAAQLRAKYAAAGLDVSRVEPVDYVSDGRPMTQLIGKHGHFAWIVASHVIEHVPDLITFMNDCATLLRPDGVLVLAVPDKRACFDALQPRTRTGEVIQAFLEKRTRPTPGQCFDSLAYDVVKGGRTGWVTDDPAPFAFANTVEQADLVYLNAVETTSYIDVHVWRFTPSSFRLILHDLHQSKFVRLREHRFEAPGVGEFYVALSCTGAGCPFARLDLALKAVAEEHEVRLTAA